MTDGMSWDKELQELERRKALVKEMGGADKVARQHAGGRQTVRERVAALADPGSFHEVGAVALRCLLNNVRISHQLLHIYT